MIKLCLGIRGVPCSAMHDAATSAYFLTWQDEGGGGTVHPMQPGFSQLTNFD